ncbi:MAG: VOC family protein, partial [Acidobacteriota bacterium]|nr:VOC family protein [Acidobacteriota bacterium]
TALYVEDLERSRIFYQTIFELATLFNDERLCAFNVADKQVLLLFLRGASTTPLETAGGTVPPHDGDGQLHLAFSISASELDEWEIRLKTMNVTIESKVKWQRGGTSIYFRDPDKHLLELVTPGLWTIY